MARPRNPARLVIALSVAAVLAVFLVYTSFAGGSTPAVQPSQVAAHNGRVQLGGVVAAPVAGDARGGGLRFVLRDVEGSETVPVVYTGSVPELFRVGREVMLEGELRSGVFVAEPGSMKTKCPSKYSPAQR
ncbi:MAG: cytochrome c maturation protein CcmE [Thermoleophilia bacterium]|nr:cytochrome c maturation protein CcmE [Thermoleophilia bacterium]MDQ3858879.1 cytochrome c maturation protein CcmE [Actinomycetota bacterium]